MRVKKWTPALAALALDDIGREIGGTGRSLADLSWVLNAYAILYAALLVPAGRLADRFGRKAGFLLGLGVFTGASLGCALSGDLWVLVGFRCLQAAGAALRFAHDRAGIRRVVAVAREDNFSSRTVLGAIGMREAGTFPRGRDTMMLFESVQG